MTERPVSPASTSVSQASAPVNLVELMKINFLPDQLAAITATSHPNVVIAGAGSGKTEVMAARVVQLVSSGEVQPERILGLTFTTLAAGELAGRIGKYLAGLPGKLPDSIEPTVSTYHSFADRFVRTYGLRIGIETDVQVLSDVRRQQLAALLLRRSQLALGDIGLTFGTVIERLLNLDNDLANYDVSIAAAMAFDDQLLEQLAPVESGLIKPARKILQVSRQRQLLLQLVEEFRELKREREVLDYADMNRIALQIAREVPQAVHQARSQFDAVLLDEYQDTSVAQRELMMALFGDGHRITGVGDPLQCIYSFQGASQSNITMFPQHFPANQPAVTKRLELPWTLRNGEHIVAIANQLTSQLRAAANLPELRAVVPAAHGPGQPIVASFATAQEEVEWLAGQIQAEIAAGTPAEKIAVLLKTNAQVAWYHNALTQLGVPAQIRGKRSLLHVPEVAELVALLRIVAEPAANKSWVRVLAGPRWRLSNRDLAALGDFAASLVRRPTPDAEPSLDLTLQQALDKTDAVDIVAYGDAVERVAAGDDAGLSPAAADRVRALAAEVKQLRSHMHESLPDFIFRVARTTGLLVESAAHSARVKRGMQVNLRSFVGMAADFTSIEGTSSLFSFLDFIADAERFDKQPELVGPVHQGAVELMTVHSAKGLQYDVVAIPRLTEGKFPDNQTSDSWLTSVGPLPTPLRREDLPEILQVFPPLGRKLDGKYFEDFGEAFRLVDREEEWRLVYVAVTRTRRKLLATHSYTYPGDNKVRPPSAFWQIIHDAAVARLGQAALGPILDQAPTEVPLSVTAAAWPVPLDSPEQIATRELAAEVRLAMADQLPGEDLDWADIDAAIAAIEADVAGQADTERRLPLPPSLSVSQLLRLAAEPDGFLADLLRPMPVAPNPAAARGTAFHSWVEDRYQRLANVGIQYELDLGEVAADQTPSPIDPATLAQFRMTFEASEWADRRPEHIEFPFALPIAGRVLRGRIDAVFFDADTRQWWLIDWKTNLNQAADRLQLSIYREGFAKAKQCDPSEVRVGFYYVASDRTVWDEAPYDLAQIERILLGEPL